MERRFTSAAPQKLSIVSREKEPRKIAGYGAVFYAADDGGTEYQLWDDMVERLMPGCFDRALREDDVRSLFNHDSNLVLGRNRAGTLKLSIDAKGLYYEVAPPDTQLCRDQVVAPIERQDVTGSSFMFEPLKTVWIEQVTNGRSLYIREIHDVKLWEVGPVVFPAYEATTTGVREHRSEVLGQASGARGSAGFCRGEDAEAIRAELKAWLEARRRDADAVMVHATVAAARERDSLGK